MAELLLASPHIAVIAVVALLILLKLLKLGKKLFFIAFLIGLAYIGINFAGYAILL